MITRVPQVSSVAAEDLELINAKTINDGFFQFQ
jgi:hypothetical protein